MLYLKTRNPHATRHWRNSETQHNSQRRPSDTFLYNNYLKSAHMEPKNRLWYFYMDNYIALYITTYMLTMQISYELKMNLYSDPIQSVVVRNRRNRSEETHYVRASVAASLLDAHFLFLSSPTHTLFLWRPLKSPHTSAWVSAPPFIRTPPLHTVLIPAHPPLQPLNGFFGQKCHALWAPSWKSEAHHVWWHECTICLTSWIKCLDSLKSEILLYKPRYFIPFHVCIGLR